jgi:SAM-dependent methyltransferase
MRINGVSFDRELVRGIAAYNGKVGRWWLRQATNSSHRNAYRKIADFIHASFREPPGLIVDYACGAGSLLFLLLMRFPRSRLIGYDGAPFLLNLARQRLAHSGKAAGRQVRLVQALLPDFQLPRGKADLVVFAFPNMLPSTTAGASMLRQHPLSADEKAVARELSRRRDPESTRDEDPAGIYSALLRDRLIAHNMRRLLKRRGICMRVEYGSAPRDELPELELLRIGFEEGSLDQPVSAIVLQPSFRIAASRYYPSKVIEDVAHQTADRRCRKGGFFITVLRAV